MWLGWNQRTLEGDTYSEDVNNTENYNYDARGDNDSPEGESEGLLARGLLVEVSENANTNDYHKGSESNEAGR